MATEKFERKRRATEWYLSGTVQARSQKHSEVVQRIGQFVTVNGLSLISFQAEGKTLWSIGDDKRGVLPPDLVTSLLREQTRVEEEWLYAFRCYPLALSIAERGMMSGVLHTQTGAFNLTDWGNHAINYLILPNGSHITADFTTPGNIDHYQGEFDLLTVTAESATSLISLVGKLYGGIWHIIPRNEYKEFR